jgi:demethylmenaquinone methyltransferase/2-methoxy-6-polyprenyl-1,4-benzoquinol methylase
MSMALLNESSPEFSRVRRTRDEAKASYDRLSKIYDLLSAGSEQRFREIGLKALEIQTGERVLEIGSGTGQALVTMAQRVGNEGRVFGIDLSPGMTRVALRRVQKAGLTERISLFIGDAGRLPFTSESFGAAFMAFTLELFDTPEIPKVLQECQRVLRNGASLCVVGLSKGRKSNIMLAAYEWMHEKYPSLVDCRPIPLHDIIDEAGFCITRFEMRSMWRLPVEIVLAQKRVG